MKVFILVLSLAIIAGCDGYKTKDAALVGIENNYLLKSDHVSNTKTLANKPAILCEALTLDENEKPTRVTGYVISNNRELATLYFDSEDSSKFETRNYFARIENDGSVTRYENAGFGGPHELVIKVERNANNQLVITRGYDNEKVIFDRIKLDKVKEVRTTIQNCKAQ